jgi:hypothetical protein
MDRRALQHALKGGGRFGFLGVAVDEICEFAVEVMRDLVAQIGQGDAARAQHRHGILIVGQGQQQMLQRRVFVIALVGDGKGAVECLFKVARQHLYPFPGVSGSLTDVSPAAKFSSRMGWTMNFIPFPSCIAAAVHWRGRNP